MSLTLKNRITEPTNLINLKLNGVTNNSEQMSRVGRKTLLTHSLQLHVWNIVSHTQYCSHYEVEQTCI